MKRNFKIATKILIISVLVVVIISGLSELDIKYNILNDFYGTFMYYTLIVDIYIAILTIVFILYSFIKSKLISKY